MTQLITMINLLAIVKEIKSLFAIVIKIIKRSEMLFFLSLC